MSEDMPRIGIRLIPLKVAGPLAGYSVASLYRFAREGRLALVKRGARTYIAENELDRFLQAESRPFVPGETVIAGAGWHHQSSEAGARPFAAGGTTNGNGKSTARRRRSG